MRPLPLRPDDASVPSIPYRRDVEGLRGVAILAVIAYHLKLSWAAGGFVGVDVFFVLSGYLITALLFNELVATGTISLVDFYARRIRRLLPSSAVAVVGTLILASIVWPPLRLVSAADGARAAALWASNILFSARATDYFGNSGPNPLLHTWSLSVEEQFYFVWPTIMLLAAGRLAQRRRLAGVLVVLAAVSLGMSWWWTIARRPTAFFGTPTRAWEFAVGGLIALLPSASRTETPTGSVANSELANVARLGAGWFGLLLVGIATAGFSDQTAFPGLHATIPVAGTALLLAVGSDSERRSVGRALSHPILQWVGRHSYGWYLWHWPLLVLGATAIPAGGLVTRLGLVIVALGLAVVARTLIEEPFRRSPRLRGRPRLVVAIAVIGAVALVGGTTVVRDVALIASRSPAQRTFSAATFDTPRINGDGCNTEQAADSTARLCEYNNAGRDEAASVLLFGDSHAGHWFPALEAVARDRHWRLLVLTKSACPAADVSVYEPALQRVVTECDGWRRAALDSIRARRPSLVVISSSTQYVLDAPRYAPQAYVTPREWERGLARTLFALRASGTSAVIIRDTPIASEDIPVCLMVAAWHGSNRERCSFALNGAVHTAVASAEHAALGSFPEDRAVDLTEAVCPRGFCAAVDDGVVLYRDARHLTAKASRRLAPALNAALTEIGRHVGGQASTPFKN